MTADVDLVDMWASDDENFLYVSYRLQGQMKNGYFYHVFFDCDLDTSTGFHSGGSFAGIDYMVENTSLWEYSGSNGEWSWTYRGEIGLQKGKDDPSRIELAVDRFLLAQKGMKDVLGLIFNINDNNENVPDDYAPDAYTDHSYYYVFQITSLPAKEKINHLPETYSIKTYPNPFNNQVTVEYFSLSDPLYKAVLYNVLGEEIRTFNFGGAVSRKFRWDGTNSAGQAVGSGFYVLKLITEKKEVISKLVLLK